MKPTPIIHYTHTTTDHTTCTTLCGRILQTDREGTATAIASTQWVSCPLCEAALILDGTDLHSKAQAS